MFRYGFVLSHMDELDLIKFYYKYKNFESKCNFFKTLYFSNTENYFELNYEIVINYASILDITPNFSYFNHDFLQKHNNFTIFTYTPISCT